MFFEHPATIAIIAAVGTVLAAWGAQFIKEWFSARSRKKEVESVLAGMERSQASYSLLSSMRQETTASRILLLAGHNSGGYPRPGSPFYVSGLFWSVDDAQDVSIRTLPEYKNLPVDADYIKMLLDAEKEGLVVLDVERMPPCQLKRYYQAEGVKHSVLFYLTIKDRKFLYCTACKHTDIPFSETELTTMELKAAALRELLNKG